ncbi:MAG: hypothetical protein OXD37_07720 [Acidimicrobiaceae bacterium]|nr:hypothetical protein [Acidimicrobiaceae bacterium]
MIGSAWRDRSLTALPIQGPDILRSPDPMACAQALHRVSNNYYYYIINAEVLPLPGSRGRADREAERQPGINAEALLLPVSHESNNFLSLSTDSAE